MDEKTARRSVELPASRAFVVQFAASAGDEAPFGGASSIWRREA
jgi:hypothetical protein